ncbi:MAG: hypothetical protein ACJ738_11310 [Gaiellales bacterium]|nr:hypothetical protein [Gaiellales bacterium]
MNHADFWVVMFLAVGLKLPLIGLFYVIWKAAKLGDQAHAAQGSAPVSRMALCGYCGARITIGYDAGRVHQRAAGIAARTGQAAFDVETRLVREELALPDRYPVEPTRCPGCGEHTVWAPIEALPDSAAIALEPLRPDLN